MNPKEVAGRRAAEFVKDGNVVGLGTGSTVYYTFLRLAERINSEKFAIRGVPTSKQTEQIARNLGIPLVDFEQVTQITQITQIDLTIDGADEIDSQFNMIKGGGGALLREKVVASASKERIIVVDSSKLVERLGERFALPVEVVPFAWLPVSGAIKELGAEPKLRLSEASTPFLSDNGNHILDCTFPGIDYPAVLSKTIKLIPGVVESGLFIGLADILIIGKEDGSYEERQRFVDNPQSR